MRRITDTAAASDIHLGSKRSHIRLLHRVWETLYHHSPPRQFIVNGDFFDDIDDVTDDEGAFSEQKYERLPKSHRAFVEFLANVHRDGVSSVVVTEGNHDRNRRKRLIRLKTPLLPFPIVESHSWELAGLKWLAIHGHTLDPEWLHHRWVPEVANKVFRGLIQRFDGDGGTFSRWTERRTTTHRRRFLRKLLPPALAAYGLKVGVDHVIGGHSHDAVRQSKYVIDGATAYSHNCGCWVSDHCTWLSLNIAGGVRLHTIDI